MNNKQKIIITSLIISIINVILFLSLYTFILNKEKKFKYANNEL